MVHAVAWLRWLGFTCLVVGPVCAVATCYGQTYNVADALTMGPMIYDWEKTPPGETQSTVVPPGVNSGCPAGRLLATSDGRRPPGGVVFWRNLEAGTSASAPSTFDSPANANQYDYVTNDHDLLTLPNGHVLYLTGAASGTPLTPKPAWFDVSERGFVPHGARSNLMAWRSTDCGLTFHYLGEFDPAKAGDGSCAMPQWFRHADKTTYAQTSSPPPDASPTHPYYDMGGSDGQLVTLNAQTGQLYLTFQCVGFLQDTTVKDHFALSQTPLNKTVLATSTNEGATWSFVGTIPTPGWRFGTVVASSTTLYLCTGTGIITAKRPPLQQSFQFSTVASVPGVNWGWNQSGAMKAHISALNAIHANIWASTVISRVPNSGMILIAIPTDIANLHGYRVFLYDPALGKYAEQSAVVPQSNQPDDATMHLVVDDSGGALLLYWTDLNFKQNTATVRGRVVYGADSYSPDFPISQKGGKAASWSLVKDSFYWYGDYQTASGYVHFGNAKAEVQTRTSEFYPVWIQPDKTVQYTHLQAFDRSRDPKGPTPIPGRDVKTITPREWNITPVITEASQLPRNGRQLNEQEIHLPPGRPRTP